MVDVPSLGVQAAATTTFNERIVGHLDEDELVHRDACIDHSLGLVWRPGKAVEQTPLFCDVGLRQAVLHEVNNELAWNEFACGHVFLCLFAQLSALFDVGAQDVAGGNVNVAEFLLDALALRSLARSRRACDDNERAVRATLRHACQTHCPANANSCLAAPTSHDRGSNGSAEEYYATKAAEFERLVSQRPTSSSFGADSAATTYPGYALAAPRRAGVTKPQGSADSNKMADNAQMTAPSDAMARWPQAPRDLKHKIGSAGVA
eukprot:CAMPEP_0117540944 /NCGR_PEP_ID=MMETSP0784-20121206/43760_1 /TAXON_ID=39447 /ORGANISM="" /LENGTH=262 /DNA_ID=CAMNT_0005337615 /DNA_START=197 /DNA_END=986 /DNA_ORIENTATION=-